MELNPVECLMVVAQIPKSHTCLLLSVSGWGFAYLLLLFFSLNFGGLHNPTLFTFLMTNTLICRYIATIDGVVNKRHLIAISEGTVIEGVHCTPDSVELMPPQPNISKPRLRIVVLFFCPEHVVLCVVFIYMIFLLVYWIDYMHSEYAFEH